MTAAVSRQINIPLIADFPNVLDELILSYVGRLQIELIANHSKFAGHAAVVAMNKCFEKEDAEAGRLGYPQSMIAMFKAHDLSLLRLPRFQLSHGKLSNQLAAEDVPSCLMRYHEEMLPGLSPPDSFLLKIRQKVKNLFIQMDGAKVYHICMIGDPRPGIENMWAEEEHPWWSAVKIDAYRNFHAILHGNGPFENCKDCLVFQRWASAKVKSDMLAQFLKGTDPCFELDGPVQQVDNPLRLAAPQEESAPEKESV